MKKWVIITFVITIAMSAHAEEKSNKRSGYLNMPVNISVWKGYSIGDLIAGERRVTNYISLNILKGSAAKLRGIEVGLLSNEYTEDIFGIQIVGLANVVDDYAKGVQLAGLANVVDESFIGIQMSGLANVVGDYANGIQLAGLANVVDESFTGIQMSGLANVVGDYANGIQLAGFANVVDESFLGIQMSGLANVVGDYANGVQLAGLANVVDESFLGIQMSGLANVVGDYANGVQLAGLANVVDESFTGIQMSGLANVVEGDFMGIQMGLINVSDNVEKGIQIGIFNKSDEDGVIPVGVASLVDDTPTYIDVWADEAKFLNAGFRSGTRTIYNVAYIGAQVNEPFRWTLGWKIGLHKNIRESTYLEIDAGVQHINEDEFWTGKKNMLSRLRILGGWQLSETMSIFAGPTFNYFISEVHDGSDLASWSLSDKKSGDKWKRLWPGVIIGVRFDDPGISDFIKERFFQ